MARNQEEKWQESILGDVCFYVSEKIDTNLLSEHNYISTENMLPEKSGITFSAALPTTKTTSSFKKYDVLVSNIRPYFKKIWHAKFNGGCSNDILVFRANENTNIKFLYYVLSDNRFFDYATKTSKGTKMPRGDKTAILKYPISIPPLDVQKKIAGVLGALDDKIELNNKINQNLEAQAQALFKSWFIDFEPFGGKMPNDWKIGKLLDIATYLNGLAMQKFRPKKGETSIPVLKIKELRQGFCDTNSDLCSSAVRSDYIVQDGDVIFSWSGTLLVDLWCGGICGLNQHLFKVSSAHFDKWFYYMWTKHYLIKFSSIAADKATTMGHIKREDLEKANVLIPSKKAYIKINNLQEPILEKIIANRIENRKLTELRDTLLPKLMNGEIDVDNVKID